MHDTTRRGLLVAGLSATVLFLTLVLIDYSRFDGQYMWPIFIGWALLDVLLVILALSAMWRRDTASPALARAVANLSTRHGPPPSPLASAPLPPPPAPVQVPVEVVVTAKPTPASEEPFPFTYNGYTLYSRSVALKNGGDRTIWFFAKRTPVSGSMARKPAGFHVGVNERTGLPFLKKGGGKDGEDLTPAAKEAGYQPQCSAITEDGKQCRNSARGESKYCASHFGYQPKTLKGSAKRIEGESWSDDDKRTDRQTVTEADTRARVKGAPDTKPAVRKSWFGRRKKASA